MTKFRKQILEAIDKMIISRKIAVSQGNFLHAAWCSTKINALRAQL